MFSDPLGRRPDDVPTNTGAGLPGRSGTFAEPKQMSASDERTPQPLGLADRFDELLLRFEIWRRRPVFLVGLVAAAVLLIASGWWFAGAGPPTPIEDLIPLADPDQAAQVAAGADDLDPRPPVGGSSQTAAVPVGAGDASSSDRLSVGPVESVLDGKPAERIVVHVVGAVTRPGLVWLDQQSRIHDAVAAAGGPTADADIQRLNLAAPVDDGTQIRVPARGDDVAGPLVVTPDRPTVAPSDGPASVVNVNTASAEQLQALPGVGPATAAAILAWRTEHGAFLTVDDLTLVPGIGPAKLAALRDRAAV